MKGRVIATALLLLGGAIVNVAVAWGCALLSGHFTTVWIDSDFSHHSGPVRPIPDFVRQVQNAHPASHQFSYEARSGYTAPGFDVYTIRWLGTIDWHLETSTLVVGWPFSSLWAYSTYYVNRLGRKPGDAPVLDQRASGLLLDRNHENSWWIPYLPVWPGFLINTLFYAAGLWMLFAAPFALRRWRRRRRGLCARCAYPIGTSPVCTECGRAVRSRTGEATS